uniref:Uncharacterized protein n=1 Tax=Anguilla anguilla TaxID=7936 RepID=A0A0E9Q8W0_ANGAN
MVGSGQLEHERQAN